MRRGTRAFSVKARHRAFIFFDLAVEGRLTKLIKQVCDFPQNPRRRPLFS
jgi:hypothetical protein